MIDLDDLVATARLLSSGASPSDAALRRAVSTAYFALFHAIASFAADRFVAPAAGSAAYALVYRGLDHKRIKDVFEDLSKPMLKLAVRNALRRTTISAEMRKFADVFAPTQQLRHLADYHPEISLTQSEVINLIDDTEQALDVFKTIDRTELTDVVTYVLFGSRRT